MKKILTAIVLFVFVALPMSVMAMQSITDNELSAVTGQAGVSINVDVTANLQIGTVAWGDSDGFTDYTNAGFVGIEGLNLTVHMSGRHDGAFAGLGYLMNDPIKIDVGTNDAGVSLVRIGLPTFHVSVSTLQTDIFVTGVTAGAPTDTAAQQLGSLYMSGVEVTLGTGGTTSNPLAYDAGYVTIGAVAAGPNIGGTDAYTTGNAGVEIGMNVKIDSIAIGTISYGNTAHILQGGAVPTAGLSAGYIGVTNFNLDDVTINGTVKIGIGTLNAAAMSTAYTFFGNPTMVNIILVDGFAISVPQAITGTVKLGNNQGLLNSGAALSQELGNFYIGNVALTFHDNVGSLSTQSLIQIWAH